MNYNTKYWLSTVSQVILFFLFSVAVPQLIGLSVESNAKALGTVSLCLLPALLTIPLIDKLEESRDEKDTTKLDLQWGLLSSIFCVWLLGWVLDNSSISKFSGIANIIVMVSIFLINAAYSTLYLHKCSLDSVEKCFLERGGIPYLLLLISNLVVLICLIRSDWNIKYVESLENTIECSIDACSPEDTLQDPDRCIQKAKKIELCQKIAKHKNKRNKTRDIQKLRKQRASDTRNTIKKYGKDKVSRMMKKNKKESPAAQPEKTPEQKLNEAFKEAQIVAEETPLISQIEENNPNSNP